MTTHKIILRLDTPAFWAFLSKNAVHISYVGQVFTKEEDGNSPPKFMYEAIMSDETATAMCLSVGDIKIHKNG